MRQVGLIRSSTTRFFAILVVLVFVAGLISALASGVPIFGPQRIERPADGFAVSLPKNWEYADAAVFDEGWWNPIHGAPAQQHIEFIESGGVLLARKPAMTDAGHEQCSIYVLLSDQAQDFVNTLDDDPRVVSVETRRLELPGGSSVVCDALHDDGWVWRGYLVTDGDRWLLLMCGSMSPPEDRWIPIAETLEFVPGEVGVSVEA